MTYALVLMDDHRDYLANHRAQILDALSHEPPDLVIEHIDTAQRGFTAQMRTLWDHLRSIDTHRVLLWEADFLPAMPVPVGPMTYALVRDPDLAQVALVRQPWWPNEHKAGGLLAALEQQGTTFTERRCVLEHTAGWTNNPCMFPRAIVDQHDWPDSAWSEAQYGRQLAAAGKHFAYYGARDDGPRVIHHGVRTEASHGY
ncbi:MAG: hypothetical protein AB7I38_14380 [Dehalococcoidia bacterium]